MTYRGGCLCGQIRYEIAAEPIAVAYCHCRDCQYTTGGEPAANAAFPRDALKVTKGETKIYETHGDRGGTVARHFCPNCGTSLFSVPSANPQFVPVKAGTLDDPSGLTPTIAIWTKSAQPWAHRDPNVKEFAEQPGR